MDLQPLVIAGLMLWTASAFLKHVRAGEYWDAATLTILFGLAVGLAFLLRASDFGATIEVGGSLSLSELNAASTVFVGYAILSAARGIFQTVKAVDNTQSARESKLIPPPAGTPDVPQA